MPSKPPVSMSNPLTPEKIELGKKLFFDPALSRSGNVSCNSCHDVVKGHGTSAKQIGGRDIPSVWNSAFYSVQFLDGRSNSPEEQLLEHLTDPEIIDLNQSIEAKIKNVDSRFSHLYIIPA